MAYPKHKIPFHRYTDSSEYQIDAVIINQIWPVAYWSKKLTETGQNYHTIKNDLYSIVMVLKYFCSMLFGIELFIYTDHTNYKNFTFANLNFSSIFHWHCLWKSIVPPFSNTLARKMSLVTHVYVSHIVVCCQFQWGRMFLLISWTLPFKALTSVMTLTCSSASSLSSSQLCK